MNIERTDIGTAQGKEVDYYGVEYRKNRGLCKKAECVISVRQRAF